MSNTRADVLATARGILREHSLADLTMRRLATELGVSPNALYWHFPNKQTMLAALADDILDSVTPPIGTTWDTALVATANSMRNALLAVPDSAEVVSSSWASGLAHNHLADRLAACALAGGVDEASAHGSATAICQLVIGLTIEEQTRSQMQRLGAIEPSGRDFDREFGDALAIVVDGVRTRSNIDPER